jgi:ABC-type hemin transport system ATPase subunit
VPSAKPYTHCKTGHVHDRRGQLVALDVEHVSRRREPEGGGEPPPLVEDRRRHATEVLLELLAVDAEAVFDEPAAGLPDEETAHLGEVIRKIPQHIGAQTILVDHDMSLVSSCCETTAVLDFGRLLAAGATAEVLRDESVIRAYLGTEEVA